MPVQCGGPHRQCQAGLALVLAVGNLDRVHTGRQRHRHTLRLEAVLACAAFAHSLSMRYHGTVSIGPCRAQLLSRQGLRFSVGNNPVRCATTGRDLALNWVTIGGSSVCPPDQGCVTISRPSRA